MKQPDKITAPALIRGIHILRLLETEPPLTLEAVASKTGIPKASALRLLQTLCDLQLVERDQSRKTYAPLARLVPVAGSADKRKRVQDVLLRLAKESEHTAEWYVPAEQGMVLVQRREPHMQQVHVVARIGFVRPWHGELDAVACVAWAHAGKRADAADGFWVYDRNGNRATLTTRQVDSLLVQARKDGCASDEHYNTNGVRRVAAAVLHDGELSGVLALAGSYRPGNGDHLRRAAMLLRREADVLGESQTAAG
ncbi:MAG: helix-turn-helix domain-containing protein [Chitinivibrionales bacterium]|nr:helix-turn-helix domain-containing protein [Chitinivibrionales bacterium]